MLLDAVQLKLEKLREFDSLIDFSRSRLQLDIILQFAGTQKPLSASDIAKELGQRKKPVLDALRKLELKGIIKRINPHENVYELTELGKSLIDDLVSVIGSGNIREALYNRRRYGKVEARDLLKILIPVNYLYDVIVALGTSRSRELPLSTLSKIAGISEQRLAMYLEPYVSPKSDIRLLRKIHKETLLLKIRNFLLGTRKTATFYILTSLGMETFYRLPVYTKIKNNPILKIITQIFNSYSPKLILHRTSLMNVVLGSMVVSLSLLIPGIAPIIALCWAILWMLLGTLLLIAYR